MIRNIRYRRDQRQLEEEEEIWFNEEDDFPDVVPSSKADIETYSKCFCVHFFKFPLLCYDFFFNCISFHSMEIKVRKKMKCQFKKKKETLKLYCCLL